MKKTQELEELRRKDKKALFSEMQAIQKNLTEKRFGLAFRKIKNYHEITNLRKRLARIWTILGEKSIVEIKKDER